MKISCAAASLVCAWSCLIGGLAPHAFADITQLQKNFQTPPDDARIMCRWWWFGPAVSPASIDHDLNAMKAGGVGGFEVQPTYPLVVNSGSGASAVTNLKFMSPQHLSMLGYTAAKAKALGLRMDLTLGSGWPYGGPMFSSAQTGGESAGKVTTANVTPTTAQISAHSVPVPSGLGGNIVAVAGLNGTDATNAYTLVISGGNATLPANFTSGQKVYFTGFIQHTTGVTQVKRPAYGADGPVIDHLSASIVDKFIKEIAEPEIKACGRNPPFAVFCDSLEIGGENWTAYLLPEFKHRRGYDLTIHLPALANSVDRYMDIRYDWARTVTDIFDDNFNTQFKNLANRYGSRFRIQGYGSPPAGLLSYGYADLPEGEGGGNDDWRSFRATRYAASASHLMNQNLASSETFTWLHAAPFRATPTDMKAEVDTHFLDGINQIDCHGWPGYISSLSYPGTSFYAAAVFNDQNPWYVAMPEVSGYMQRVSQILREGTPANDIALYLNDADIWAAATTSFSSMNASYTNQAGMLGTILDAGYNLDAWDDGMLAQRGSVDAATGSLAFGNVKYRVVVLNGATRMPLATAQKLQQFSDNGGILVIIGTTLPSIVPGYMATAADQTSLSTIMKHIFTDSGHKGIQTTTASFATDLAAKLTPDFVTASPSTIGAVHRHADGGDIYFIANTSNTPQTFNATFRQTGHPELWDPLTTKVYPLTPVSQSNDTTTLALTLPAYGSTLVVFTSRQLTPTTTPTIYDPLDLSTDWAVTFATGPGGSGAPVTMTALADWTTLTGMSNYSGVATYQKTITVPAEMVSSPMVLSFGSYTTGVYGPTGGSGVYANIKPPVLDAAVVFVNGKRAGAAWCPPYQVDVTGLLVEGQNTIRIDVGNTAINYLQKAGFPNYNQTAVDAAYPPGGRFSPQNTNYYTQTLPSGILGPILLQQPPH